MLQQTQTTRVVPRFHQFLARFPTPADCADASVGEVIALWQGLGYNRRAVNLHRAATAIVADHDGEVPDDLDDLLALPGVGPYTARAVAVFAHEQHHGVVDTNVARVLARAVAGRSLGAREVQALADDLVPDGRSWAYNQAVMEHGATTCTKRSPDCGSCRVAVTCAWRERGGPDPVTGTAFTTTPQSTFEGSDRQGRGRLVAALASGPVAREAVADVVDWDDPDRVAAMLAGVVADGLAVVDDDLVRLPG
nr:A/G-specific adenine glycosylase [Salsipaludibacter albus]